MEHSIWEWSIFTVLIMSLVMLDLGIFHKIDSEIKIKDSIISSFMYIAIGLAFGFWIWNYSGAEQGKEYLTGFIIEKTLALDNIFIFIIIFNFFGIPDKYQYKVLFWGILGAIISRAIMIGIGAKLLEYFSWIHYIFEAFLLFTGVKMLWAIDKKIDIQNSVILGVVKKYINITDEICDGKFYISKPNSDITKPKQIFFTPLALSLVMIEIVDIIFAIDSVPAIFSITKDPYIVFTSNIFAILGLRSLYFALKGSIKKFYYLKFSLAFVLIFIGSKSLIASIFSLDKLPINFSLTFTIGIIAAGILYSIYKPKPELSE